MRKEEKKVIQEKKGKFKQFVKRIFGSEKGEGKKIEVKVEEGIISKPNLTPEKQEELNQRFLKAAELGYTDEVEKYLKLGANVNIQDENGWTALTLFAWWGDTDTCKVLIKYGADVNIRDKEGKTALMWAAWYRYPGTCTLLIENGADVNIQDNEGWTVLMNATDKKSIEIVRHLISVGANPLLKNEEGQTAYNRAIKEEIDQILKEYTKMWKLIGEENALLIQQSVRNCEPSRIEGIIKGL